MLFDEEHSLLEVVLLYKCDDGCACCGYGCGSERFVKIFLGFLVSLAVNMYALLR